MQNFTPALIYYYSQLAFYTTILEHTGTLEKLKH